MQYLPLPLIKFPEEIVLIFPSGISITFAPVCFIPPLPLGEFNNVTVLPIVFDIILLEPGVKVTFSRTGKKAYQVRLSKNVIS